MSRTYSQGEQANLAVVRKLFEDGFGRNDPAVLDAVLASNFVFFADGNEGGIDALKGVMAHNHACFAEWGFVLHRILADGNLVSVHWTATGTHRGTFAGEEPTGNAVSLTGTSVYELADGRIVRDWLVVDMLGFLVQLGAVEAPAVG
jgi:predicted ester cyclase